MHYQDFELEISRNSTGTDYLAKVRSPQGEAQQCFSLPDVMILENLILKMRGFSRSSRSANSPEVQAASRLGELLYKNAFGGDISNVFKSCLDHTSDDNGLRIKLILQDTPELSSLPWEFLYLTNKRDFLAHSPVTPIVRYLQHAAAIKPLAVTLPLNLLVVIASPSDLGVLNTAAERQELEQALAHLENEALLRITWIEHATVAKLAEALEVDSFHLLHFIGHSHFDDRRGEGALVFEDESGRSDYYEATRLKVLLHDHHALRLVVLNSCDGAKQDDRDPFSSIATTLMLAGIPAVIAMQFEISDRAAIVFARIFYKWLATGTAIDEALGKARKYLFAVERNNVEWGTPVLYLRAKDGVLFTVDSKERKRLELEKLEQDKAAQEKERKRLEQEKLEQDKAAQEKERKRLELEKLEQDKAAQEKERKRLEQEKLEQDKAAQEKERKRLEQEKQEQDKAAQEKERKRLEQEKQEQDKAAQEKERQRLEQEKAAQEKERKRLEQEKQEQDKAAQEKECKRLEQEKLEQLEQQKTTQNKETWILPKQPEKKKNYVTSISFAVVGVMVFAFFLLGHSEKPDDNSPSPAEVVTPAVKVEDKPQPAIIDQQDAPAKNKPQPAVIDQQNALAEKKKKAQDDLFGEDVDKQQAAVIYLTELTTSGDTEAMQLLGAFYIRDKNYKEGCLWYKKATENGNQKAKVTYAKTKQSKNCR